MFNLSNYSTKALDSIMLDSVGIECQSCVNEDINPNVDCALFLPFMKLKQTLPIKQGT